MTREEAHTLLEVMAIELTGELADIERPVTERTRLLGKQLKAIDMAIEALQREEAEEKGHCHRIRPGNVEVVVRCKDCVRKREWLVDYTHDSDWFCTLHECAMNDDDFCSYGERREP